MTINRILITFIFLIVLFGMNGFASAQDKSLKRGICGDASPQDLSVLSASITWYYDWGVAPPAISQGQLSGIEWVPMCWGGVNPGDISGIEAKIPAGSKYLLGFNEPNFKFQANLTPSQAASMWPNLEQIAADKGLELVSPAVNWCGDCVAGVTSDPTDWLDKFFAACTACKVDYIAIHNYAPGSAALKSYVEKFRKYGKPLWITEFAPWDPPKPDYEGVVKYMKEVIPYLENEPVVFRYSWFATRVNSNPDINLLDANGIFTKLGQLYTSMAFQGLNTDIGPVAMAGSDISISISTGTVKLRGSVYDANGDVISVAWTQLGGPGIAAINDSTLEQPEISDLAEGTYIFRLEATAGGKTDTDEVTVIVGPSNIALGKPIFASSDESTSTPATGANDGNLSTRWSSAFSDPQWITIDLQSSYNINGARIVWEAAASKNYQIQISDNGTNWSTVFSTSSGNGGTDNFTFTATARYIRMYSTARTTSWGNSIYEFEVYGTISQTGIDDNRIRKSFSVYPNPSNGGVIKLSLRRNWSPEDVSVSITNVSGQQLFSEQISSADILASEISLQTGDCLKPGLYILVMRSRNTLLQSKLLIR